MDGIGLANVWGVTRAYPKIDVGQVAVAAWGILDMMQGVDQDRITTFFEAYAGSRDISPEWIPCNVPRPDHNP
jgi:hypothetical protein